MSPIGDVTVPSVRSVLALLAARPVKTSPSKHSSSSLTFFLQHLKAIILLPWYHDAIAFTASSLSQLG